MTHDSSPPILKLLWIIYDQFSSRKAGQIGAMKVSVVQIYKLSELRMTKPSISALVAPSNWSRSNGRGGASVSAWATPCCSPIDHKEKQAEQKNLESLDTGTHHPPSFIQSNRQIDRIGGGKRSQFLLCYL